jgi:hypothetical protein
MPSLEIKTLPPDTFELRVISKNHNRYYAARGAGMGVEINPV